MVINFDCPTEKEEQTEIDSILSSLDDKIELNLQMNKTLEATAQAIFKEWFINFNFPGFDGVLVKKYCQISHSEVMILLMKANTNWLR